MALVSQARAQPVVVRVARSLPSGPNKLVRPVPKCFSGWVLGQNRRENGVRPWPRLKSIKTRLSNPAQNLLRARLRRARRQLRTSLFWTQSALPEHGSKFASAARGWQYGALRRRRSFDGGGARAKAAGKYRQSRRRRIDAPRRAGPENQGAVGRGRCWRLGGLQPTEAAL